MKKSVVKNSILKELEKLIIKSCKNPSKSQPFNQLHIALIKKYYNATSVSIDYHRKRVKMDIILDDSSYDPKRVNTYLPTIPTNLLFKNLSKFLKTCIDYNIENIAFYALLIKTFNKPKTTQLV